MAAGLHNGYLSTAEFLCDLFLQRSDLDPRHHQVRQNPARQIQSRNQFIGPFAGFHIHHLGGAGNRIFSTDESG